MQVNSHIPFTSYGVHSIQVTLQSISVSGANQKLLHLDDISWSRTIKGKHKTNQHARPCMSSQSNNIATYKRAIQ